MYYKSNGWRHYVYSESEYRKLEKGKTLEVFIRGNEEWENLYIGSFIKED